MSTVELLRAHAPAAPEALHTRVLALRPQPRRRRARPLLLVAAAAGIAVAAALVHGFSTSAPTAPQRHIAQHLQHFKLSASGGSGGGTATTPTSAAAAPFQRNAIPAPAPNRLQHTDASIRIRVPGTDALGRATTQATRIASSLGGYAQSVVYRTPQGGGGASYLELRVPAQNVKAALTRLAGLGDLVSQQISIQDLTNELQRESAQITELRAHVAALQQALQNPALPEAQRVLLQIRLADAKRALAQRLHGRKGTLTSGATARISLVLTTQKHAAAPPPHRGRLGRMLHSAVGFLALEGIVLLFALIVASPLAVALVLLYAWRRRATDRLLME